MRKRRGRHTIEPQRGSCESLDYSIHSLLGYFVLFLFFEGIFLFLSYFSAFSYIQPVLQPSSARIIGLCQVSFASINCNALWDSFIFILFFIRFSFGLQVLHTNYLTLSLLKEHKSLREIMTLRIFQNRTPKQKDYKIFQILLRKMISAIDQRNNRFFDDLACLK